MTETRLRIGFIPLCDAAALLIAVDKGFAAAEGLDIELLVQLLDRVVHDTGEEDLGACVDRIRVQQEVLKPRRRCAVFPSGHARLTAAD